MDTPGFSSDGHRPKHEASLGHRQIVIIGSGFAGLAAAIQLRKAGYQDLVILERAAQVGGTWRDNHYPGAACDIPSHLYSLSFAPNPSWSSTYPNQPEIQAYLEDLVDKFELRALIRFDHEVQGIAYQQSEKQWRIQTNQGVLRATYVWACQGGLSQPKIPDLPGAQDFRGSSFHSSRWDHSFDLRGKRVAVIGTGASAIQFVPQIAKQAERVDVYQRTAPWIIPRIERPYTSEEKRRFERFDVTRLAHRWFIYWQLELRGAGLLGREKLRKVGEKVARAHLHRSVKDKHLRQALSPRYNMGCKRILLSNDYYPTLTQDHVHLITDPIQKVESSAIVSGDGTRREIDLLIYGTGFYTTDNPLLMSAQGKDGVSVKAYWANGEKAYWGTMIPGFPNFFMIVGPNTGLGHNSQLFMIEAQIDYALKIQNEGRRRKASSIEVTQEATDRFDRKIQHKMKGTVWKSGCQSWYQSQKDPDRVSAIWPGWTFEFWAATRRIDRNAFLFT